jgi:diadenosine tetraphosphate (Ap4A) HIT family hydrolase
VSSLANTIVGQRVALAREGRNPWLVARVSSGWVVMSDKQVVPGQLILLADPVVTSLNDLGLRERIGFLADMALIGDALLAVTGCLRVNYDILGNTDPALHAHIVPRYASETDERRVMPIWLYDWSAAELFSEDNHGELRRALGAEITRLTRAQAAE